MYPLIIYPLAPSVLGPKDQKPYRLSSREHDALINFYSSVEDAESVPRRSTYRWTRFQIPTGQIARSYWKEVTGYIKPFLKQISA